MKRKPALERALRWHLRPGCRKPKFVVPPKSIVRVVRVDPDMKGLSVGDIFRIGYYSRQDGPAVVWLVDDTGKYGQTWDQKSLLDYFEIIERSGETDTYGIRRPPLGPR